MRSSVDIAGGSLKRYEEVALEEEIDLREYVEVLWCYKGWIAGLAVASAVVALVVSLLLPPVYEARAVVVVTQPRYQLQFDPRFEAATDWSPAYKAFPELAKSDEVLAQVVEGYVPSPEAEIKEWGVGTLSKMVEASSEGDPSLVVLRVRSRSAEDAAAIVNRWADVLCERGNAIYGQGEEDVARFARQAEEAKQALTEAEDALIAFQAQNEEAILQAQLDSLQQKQADYLGRQRAVEYLKQDIVGLREQLAQQPGEGQISLADELTSLFLQIKAFNAQVGTIQLQVSSAEAFSQKRLEEQVAFLDGLVETLDERKAEIEEVLTELEPQILMLQQRLAEVRTEKARLTRARDLAHETYMAVARKLEEAKIAAQDEGIVQVGGYAVVPEEPDSPKKLLNTGVAGALGLMLGVFGAFAVEWWRSGPTLADR